jgi:hypothetical protein
MMFLCKGWGKLLIVPRDEIRFGKFSDLLIFTVPPHRSRSVQCPWSGRIHVEGMEQGPKGVRSTKL